MIDLPVELWHLVADDLTPSQLRSFLGISRLHRLIAIKSLFSHIKIFYGVPELMEYPEMAAIEAEQLYESTMNQTWDILNTIRSDQNFASAVKHLHVHAFMDNEPFGVFHRGPLTDALKYLPHLSSFTWSGSWPTLPLQVFESLLQSCHFLQAISIPVDAFMVGLVSNTDPPRHLDSLTLGKPVGICSSENILSEVLPHVENILTAGSVSSISGPTTLLWNLPIRSIEGLVSLEISYGEDIQNIDIVFRYATGLRSLTITEVLDQHIFDVFSEHPTSLPHLTSFKIMALHNESDGNWSTSADLSKLAEFLRTKRGLERLDIHLGCSSIEPMLEAICELGGLRVLGLFTGFNVFTAADYHELSRLITPKLTALRLSTKWEVNPNTQEARENLIGRLGGLSFLYIRNFDLPFAFLMDELASLLENVSILGLDQRISHIHRGACSSSEGDQLITAPWSSRRVHFRTVEDFDGSDDQEWLMRYHDLREWSW